MLKNGLKTNIIILNPKKLKELDKNATFFKVVEGLGTIYKILASNKNLLGSVIEKKNINSVF